jgi:hypothetical protein
VHRTEQAVPGRRVLQVDAPAVAGLAAPRRLVRHRKGDGVLQRGRIHVSGRDPARAQAAQLPGDAGDVEQQQQAEHR